MFIKILASHPVQYHVPYSIDSARFAAEASRLLPDRHRLCLKYGLDPDLPTFLFCGKLIEKKRPLQLLEAYVAAGLQYRAQLLYVGEGALREQIEQRIHHLDLTHVHTLGFLNQSEMPLAYVLGELLCLLSDPTETWGLVVNEALACRRPVIVSDAIGCGPYLVDPSNGWAGPGKNPEETFEKMVLGVKSAVEFCYTLHKLRRTKTLLRYCS